MKRLRIALLHTVTTVLLLAGMAAACGSDEPATAPNPAPPEPAPPAQPDPPAPPEPAPADPESPELLVGYVLPSTGSLAIIGEPILNGIKMALADIGDSGHLQVRLLPGDSGPTRSSPTGQSTTTSPRV